MKVVQPSPLELRLSAYIDGLADEQERHEIEALLVNDPQARALHDMIKRGADIGRHGFDDLLKEPVPLALVRTIKSASVPRKAIRLPGRPRPVLAFKPSGPQAFAGCVIVFLLGGMLGYMLSGKAVKPDLPVVAGIVNSDDWLDDIVANFRLYARQSEHLAEIPADRPAEILEWLTTNTGVSFRIPDLGSNGLEFKGARLFSAGGATVGQLLYRRADGNVDGEVIAIAFTKSRPDENRSIDEIRNDTALVTWSTPLATFMVLGPSATADLDDIAAKAAGLI